MPLPGSINFDDVEQFESLGEGVYDGHIEYVRFKDGSARGKSDQLSVCLVSDEEDTKDEKAWQNLYFTPKSLFRMGQFFALFGITGTIDFENGISPEEPFDLLDPDLAGEPVRFQIAADGTYRGKPSFKAEVIEWLGQPTKAAARPAARPAAKAAEPVADSTEEGGEDPEPAAPARRTFAPKTAAPAAGRRLR